MRSLKSSSKRFGSYVHNKTDPHKQLIRFLTSEPTPIFDKLSVDQMDAFFPILMALCIKTPELLNYFLERVKHSNHLIGKFYLVYPHLFYVHIHFEPLSKSIETNAERTIEMFSKVSIDNKVVEVDKGVLSPFKPDVLIDKIEVKKEFSSASKPLLCMLTNKRGFEQYVLFKRKDDLRQDMFIQNMFAICNMIWQESELKSKPFIYQYKVIPFSTDMGCLEFVKDCVDVHNFKWDVAVNTYPKERIKNLLLSMAGSYIACYILGVRDRHQDNMLIRDGDTFLHIDFGYIFNESPLIDAPRFSFHPKMIKTFHEKNIWKKFVKYLLQAFKVLRANNEIIINSACELFSYIVKKSDSGNIRKFLVSKYAFMLSYDTDKAMETIESNIDNATSSLSRAVKFFAHEVGQKLKF